MRGCARAARRPTPPPAPEAGLGGGAPPLDAAARACAAVTRLFGEAEPSEPVWFLLVNELGLLERDPRHAGHANQLAFRLKLLVAAGFAPQLSACAACGEPEHLVGFSGAAGGVVCASCEGGGFPLAAEAHAFLTDALARPLAEAPQGSDRALRQAERAIGETVEHHAHVRLRAASHG